MTTEPERAARVSQQLALGLSLARSSQHGQAIAELMRYFALGGGDAAAYDALAQCARDGADSVPGRLQGALDLARKDKAAIAARPPQPLPDHRALDDKRRIIAFTLFGSDPRYLRGALHNVLAARAYYPGWTCRFYADPSVDAALLDALRGEGAEVVLDAETNGDVRYRLCRRFLVADDPDIGRYLVRDCDSVVNAREAAAVAAWIASGMPFHAMRDWWTHSDLMLAGLWGGFANLLPSTSEALAQYLAERPDGPNWDQAFLAWHVWPSARGHILVHDRLFDSHASSPFPTPTPPGVEHVGQNQFVADRAGQARVLAPFAAGVPALGLKPRPPV